jgi:hypothetical protein
MQRRPRNVLAKFQGRNVCPLALTGEPCLKRVNRVVPTVRRSLPVYPDKQTFSVPVGMSQRCQQQKCRSVCWQPVSSRQARNFEFELVLSAFVATALQCNLIRLPPR